MSDLMELMQREEELIPELVPFERAGPLGICIHHPWIIELFYDPQRCALINERYRLKKEQVQAASVAGKWSSYVFLHERPYRVRALQQAIQAGARTHDVVGLVRQAWIDSENIWQNKSAWQTIWRRIGHVHGIMDDSEQTVYGWLPEIVEIYRGVRHPTHWPRGMSWTRGRKRAEWFARRLATAKHTPTVLTATVHKSKILAYFNGRGEEEIVVLPRSIIKAEMEWI